MAFIYIMKKKSLRIQIQNQEMVSFVDKSTKYWGRVDKWEKNLSFPQKSVDNPRKC